MTKVEMISALYEIKRTCREAEHCIDCPFHRIDEEGEAVCAFDNVFTEPSIWDDNDLMIVVPDGWKLSELEDIQ